MITLSGLLYCSFLSLQQLLQTVTDCWCRCSRPFTGMLVISGGPCPRWLRIWNRSVLSRLWAISASLPLNIPPGVACFLLLAALLHIQFAQQAWYVSGTFALAVWASKQLHEIWLYACSVLTDSLYLCRPVVPPAWKYSSPPARLGLRSAVVLQRCCRKCLPINAIPCPACFRIKIYAIISQFAENNGLLIILHLILLLLPLLYFCYFLAIKT